VDVQLVSSCLEIDIAERLKPAYFLLREFNEDAAVSCEALQIGMALPIQIGTHLLDLEIGHIADTLAQGALMAARAAELEPFDQSPVREHLARCAYHFGQAGVADKNTHDMSAACDPDNGFVFLSLQLPLRIDLEEFRMQGSLKKAEGEFVNCNIDMRCFHKRIIPSQTIVFYSLVIIQDLRLDFKLIFSTDNAETRAYRTIILQA